ncbi:hypothetical protein BJ508DRAFT_78055 [Ascobolus immersus RN42]|uniref:Uncharacterized protein n=1 Tax=Ascobolus immersus RN42 TaxID=1160509 RepID=A0A3N4IFZ4_ASCIM|nr:hypothetical protein BJ508DRAFT_78055 [Ascobolus immersus RN42]
MWASSTNQGHAIGVWLCTYHTLMRVSCAAAVVHHAVKSRRTFSELLVFPLQFDVALYDVMDRLIRRCYP